MRHVDALLDHVGREVRVLLESEDEREALVLSVQVELDVLQIAEDGSILLANLTADRMVQQGLDPEVADARRTVLNLLDIARLRL